MTSRDSLPILLVVLVASCSSPISPEEELQHALNSEIRNHGIPGVSAAIVFPDGSVWTGVSGLSHDSVAMAPDMAFAIGSVTKNVVSALALKLVEEGILDLDDPLSRWLPRYPHVHPAITIRQLLGHTSGLYMFWDNEQIWDDLVADRTRMWNPADVLKYIQEPYFSPGDGFHYSNTNYLLLATIIERSTGSTLSAELRARFWTPLGIDDAWLSVQEEDRADRAHVYGDDFVFGKRDMDVTFEPRTAHDTITFGSSGIFTTAESLARWSQALFSGRILQPSTLDEMLQMTTFEPFTNMKAYGLGVQEYSDSFSSGEEAIGHGGANIGTTTYMVYLPEFQVSIVVMINAFPNEGADFITKRLIRAVTR
jgi:D-alanyl-D-alanine carboxypeptidase